MIHRIYWNVYCQSSYHEIEQKESALLPPNSLWTNQISLFRLNRQITLHPKSHLFALLVHRNRPLLIHLGIEHSIRQWILRTDHSPSSYFRYWVYSSLLCSNSYQINIINDEEGAREKQWWNKWFVFKIASKK